ncbi:hypothetical protein, partial [Dubosiella newyorkensis]|uniref:hypothetical protein n=1 Tax=Dubosiella newyorkensis TaxID=1862672 RepID=UPI00272B24EB
RIRKSLNFSDKNRFTFEKSSFISDLLWTNYNNLTRKQDGKMKLTKNETKLIASQRLKSLYITADRVIGVLNNERAPEDQYKKYTKRLKTAYKEACKALEDLIGGDL